MPNPTSVIVNTSLRGSLAAKYLWLREQLGAEYADGFVETLLTSNSPGIERRLVGDCVVIGLAAERGVFPPDW